TCWKASSFLQITQPPIAPPRLYCGKPAAEWVKRDYDQGPHCIDHPQVVPKVGRVQCAVAAHGRYRIEHEGPRGATIPEPGCQDGQRMSGIEVQDEIKKRYSAEHDERMSGLPVSPVEISKCEQRRSQSHQQEFQ